MSFTFILGLVSGTLIGATLAVCQIAARLRREL
jgi:hypothetical protein